jgi:hypothetical protein
VTAAKAPRLGGIAYTPVVDEDGYTIGLADRGVAGYTPQPGFGKFPSWEAARDRAKVENERLGLSELEAFAIVASTMWPSKADKRTS